MLIESQRNDLQQRFKDCFGSDSNTLLLRAPGRVNLIGEHTDYNGYPVLPMAIQKDIALLFRPRGDRLVRVCDVNQAFGLREFHCEEKIEPYPTGDWGNYVKAAAQALFPFAPELKGFDGLFSGSIPSDAGLSSSSAMVVASALALIESNSISIDRSELMNMLAEAEHYVGTRGGGMDQAACLGGLEGNALRIDFFPLRVAPVPIPSDWDFLVAHSLSTASKTGDALQKYNERPQQCRQAASEICRHFPNLTVGRLADLEGSFSREGILEVSGKFLSPLLAQRVKHVLTEADRVDLAVREMTAGNILEFGRLMVESHESLRSDFEISTPALDSLVQCCLNAGAKGARMTGAGFGGCVVAVCAQQDTTQVAEYLKEHFYSGKPELARFKDYLFVAEASDGARRIG